MTYSVYYKHILLTNLMRILNYWQKIDRISLTYGSVLEEN